MTMVAIVTGTKKNARSFTVVETTEAKQEAKYQERLRVEARNRAAIAGGKRRGERGEPETGAEGKGRR